MSTFVRVVLIVAYCLAQTDMIKSQGATGAAGRVAPSPELEERCRNSNYNPLYCAYMQPYRPTGGENGGLGLGGGNILQALEQLLTGGSLKVEAKFTYDKKPDVYTGYNTDQPWAPMTFATFPPGYVTDTYGRWGPFPTTTAGPSYPRFPPPSACIDCLPPSACIDCFDSGESRPQFAPQQAHLEKYMARIFGRPSAARPQDAKLQKSTVGTSNNTTLAPLTPSSTRAST